ncbi:MAG: tRNA preQ1(34) S-adenosylmethionine ribosyltransferase-isomerase QueA [Sedimentisphaerales bacterium]|nr:tRNA preQ1(34) S-adenosylmethionine ribosyltransferase-isomerase QueA [Sedimentisphaerales bacterium]
MDTNQLDYHLPAYLIAQEPAARRGQSRLLVLTRDSGQIEHRYFSDSMDYLRAGDCLVINTSRVIPARFYLRRQTGGLVEGLFLRETEEGLWQVMLKNAGRLQISEIVNLADPNRQFQSVPELSFKMAENLQQGKWMIEAKFRRGFLDILNQYGITPLPPYIHRTREDIVQDKIDRDRYQTVYAQTAGSVAAPTAGLHFSEELLEALEVKYIQVARLMLHVGLGTFKPITTERVEDHQMHAEYYQLDEENAALINQAIQDHRRIVAVGTTSVRTLETLAENNRVRPGSGWTNVFITPGYRFRIVNTLITNFHLPRTSLLALVCAFAGTESTLKAYQQAVKHQYRFYSYGDAMLIL